MALVGDERGQAVQIGAVLLFAVLIISFSTYQAFIVPNQNRQVEFTHNQEVQSQMQDLRNAIVSTPGATSTRAVSIQLGTRYPSRAVAINPGPPTGSLRTDGTTDESQTVTVSNTRAAGETGDFWNETRSYNTGTLAYQPNYNLYGEAPTTYYEHTVAFNQFRSGPLELSGQTMVDGRQITLIALNGSVSRSSSGSTAVDVDPVSPGDGSLRTVSVTNEPGERVSVSFLSRLSESVWEDTLLDEEMADNGGYVTDVSSTAGPGPYQTITLRFEQDVDYQLRVAKAGVGTQVTPEEATYLTNVTPKETTVSEGQTVDVVVEARDAYNNPVPGVTVSASGDGGVGTEATTDVDGRATFEFDASGLAPGSYYVDTTLRSIDGTYTAGDADSATFEIVVESNGAGGGGAYSVDWTDPSGQPGVTCPNGVNGICSVDAGQTSTVSLTMKTGPIAQSSAVEYALNDSTKGTLSAQSGTTDSSGEDSVEFTPINAGGIRVFTSSGGDGDALVFDITNAGSDVVYNNDATAVDGPDSDSTTGGVEFTLSNLFSQRLEILDVTVSNPRGNSRLNDAVSFSNDQPRRAEVYIEGDTSDGYVDVNGGTNLPATFDMDSDGFLNNGNPETSSGGQFTLYLFEFENNGGNRIDMSGETFDVTVSYRLADGTTSSKTFSISPS